MRRFDFRFDRLLTLRKHEEEARRLELGKITGECHQIELQIETRLDRRRTILSRMSASEVSDVRYRLSAEQFAARLHQEAGRLRQDLAKKEEERGLAMERYRKAKQRVDVLDRFRERREAAYKQEQSRLEHSRLDEVSQQIYLRGRAKRGVGRA